MFLTAAIGFALIFLLAGCSATTDEPYSTEIYALDTYINLKIYGESGKENAALAESKITELENTLSVTKPESDVTKINSGSGEDIQVTQDTVNVINTALEVSSQTDGALDISVYPVVTLWGFTTDENRVPSDAEIDNALPLVDYSKISVDECTVRIDSGMKLDLGAVAKGYIAEKTAQALKENGVDSAVLSFGGNIQTVGTKGGELWKVGVKYPDTADCFGILSIGETAVVTSAADQRYFEDNGKKYHHIIDPSTGYPAESGAASVTVVCENGARADALSTAIFVMGIDKAIEVYKNCGDFEFIFLDENDKVYITEGISENFELSDGFGELEVEVVNHK